MLEQADADLDWLVAYELKAIEWPEEIKKLASILFILFRGSALAGAETARAGLETIGVGVDFGLVNQAVVDWARRHAGTVSRMVNETTRRFVQTEIAAWIESGEPLPALTGNLAPMFGKVRAEMIAITEVTGAFAQGNLITWKESGVVSGKRWMTAMDELVCPICQPLHKMVVELDSNGFTTEEGGLGLEAPPAHIRCRCYLQPFVEKPSG